MRVAIVGAGISGLYLAWKLAEKGNKVTVFEKKSKIGKEVCSGLFSDRILEFIPQSEKLIEKRIDFALINFPKKTLKVQFSRKFYLMSHLKLDKMVAELAERAGAKIILNYTVKEKDLIKFQKEFERIIGCDGCNSLVRKTLGLPDPKMRLAIQGFIRDRDESKPEAAKSRYGQSFVETWPTKSGFLWKIPRLKETEYGIMEKQERARELFERFLKEKNIKPQKISSALIPQTLIIPSALNPKITLCGDAMGLNKPWSGGGVVWSLLAAEILLKNFPNLLKYQRELKRFFLTKVTISKIATPIIYWLGFNFPYFLPKNSRIEGDFL